MTALGSILGLTLTHELLSVFDGSWRNTLNFYAIICGVSGCIWLLIISHPLCKLYGRNKSEESMSEICSGCLQLLRSPSIQAVLILSVGMFFYMHSTINWLPKLIAHMELGMSEADSAYWASLPIVIGMISAAIVPRFSSNNRELKILTILFVIACTSCMLLSNGMTTVLFVVALVMIGVVRGSIPPVSILLLMHLPGDKQKNIGAATGLFFAFGQIGGAMGPLTFGYLAQQSGGFDVPLYFLAGVCLFLALISLSISRTKTLRRVS